MHWVVFIGVVAQVELLLWAFERFLEKSCSGKEVASVPLNILSMIYMDKKLWFNDDDPCHLFTHYYLCAYLRAGKGRSAHWQQGFGAQQGRANVYVALIVTHTTS